MGTPSLAIKPPIRGKLKTGTHFEPHGHARRSPDLVQLPGLVYPSGLPFDAVANFCRDHPSHGISSFCLLCERDFGHGASKCFAVTSCLLAPSPWLLRGPQCGSPD